MNFTIFHSERFYAQENPAFGVHLVISNNNTDTPWMPVGARKVHMAPTGRCHQYSHSADKKSPHQASPSALTSTSHKNHFNAIKPCNNYVIVRTKTCERATNMLWLCIEPRTAHSFGFCWYVQKQHLGYTYTRTAPEHENSPRQRIMGSVYEHISRVPESTINPSWLSAEPRTAYLASLPNTSTAPEW